MGQSDQGKEKAVDSSTEDNQNEANQNENQEASAGKGAGIPPGSGGKDADTAQTPPG